MSKEIEIPYRIDFSGKRKTVAFIIERNGDVVVKAPIGFSVEKISQLIHENRIKLYQKITHPQKIKADSGNANQLSGRSVLFGGKNYKVFIDKASVGKFVFNGRFIISENISDQFSERLKQWLIFEAKQKLPPKIIEFGKKLGVEYKNIVISDLKLRWGSCTPKNNIILNYRLIKAPAFVYNYIIVHELTHLLVPNHDEEFWQKVKICFPKFEEAREWLKVNGNKLFE